MSTASEADVRTPRLAVWGFAFSLWLRGVTRVGGDLLCRAR
jgi:hypothetical protein